MTIDAGGIPGEFIHLEYAEGDKLYVPVAALELISRYTGVDPEHAPLHKLGSGQWQKARRKAAEKVYDVAAELLELHARRAARKGQSYEFDQDAYFAFAQKFPFEEKAATAVKPKIIKAK
jgi:transcription-repair coupling factor (superfamily II helicase)